MNKSNNKLHATEPRHELIISGIHLELTPSLKIYVQEKTDRLFRHEERIVRIRVELECDTNQSVDKHFAAKGRIEIHGPDMFATVLSDDCRKAIDLLVDKLDRMLRRRSRYFKVRRHLGRAVEIGGPLPKVV